MQKKFASREEMPRNSANGIIPSRAIRIRGNDIQNPIARTVLASENNKALNSPPANYRVRSLVYIKPAERRRAAIAGEVLIECQDAINSR